MPRACSICAHDEAHPINVALVQRDPYRKIAEEYGLSQAALSRHAQDHIPKLLARAKDAVEVADAGTLLDRIEALQSRVEAFLDQVEGSENYGATLGAFREMRANLELIGEVTKELDRTPMLNLHLNPEWLELRAVIVGALEPHQEARRAVLSAIESAGNGHAR